MRVHARALLLSAILLVVAAPVSAAPAVVTVGAGDVLAVGEEPAVEAPPDVEEEAEQPWTTRYLAPTVLLIGLLALGGSILYYMVRIRGRYRVKR